MEIKYEENPHDETSSKYLNNFDSNCTTNSSDGTKYGSVDDIIQKYKHKTKCVNHYSNTNLYRNVGNHALQINKPNSIQNCQIERKERLKNKNIGEQANDRILTFRCENHNHWVNKFTLSDAKLTSNEKVFHDKTTFCRPVINYYNEQFLYKTMERNARLKVLVKKLAIARQQEKEMVSWNNFINNLKTKHGEISDNRKHISIIEEPGEYTPEIIDNYYRNRFSFEQSNSRSHLLRDLYGSYDEAHNIYPRCYQNKFKKAEENLYIPHNKDPYCYPTSSQGRIIMDKRRVQQQRKQYLNKWGDNMNHAPSYKRNAHNSTYSTDHIDTHKYFRTTNKTCDTNELNSIEVAKSSAIQTDRKFNTDLITSKIKDKATEKTDDSKLETKDAEKVEGKIIKSSNSLHQISLTSIDAKLVALIESINLFINEIKLNKSTRENRGNVLKCMCNRDDKKHQIENGSDTNKNSRLNYDNKKCLSTTKVIVSKLSPYNFPSALNPDEVIQEIDVSRSRSTQIEDKYNKQARSVQIDFEIPTKDDTSVTASFTKHDLKDENTNEKSINKQIKENNKDINLQERIPLQQMTIAVNTDPLSLLALIRISTDAIKQLLSYMPNIDYYSYLSQLQFPQARNVESHYICNICGADFNKPSQLSDHITDHDLGKTRDCCVCRHVLDLARKYPGLFRCQYCGQLFARAYCCELHQESCAKRFGRRHDVNANLVLLK